jgi:hypothetical protein
MLSQKIEEDGDAIKHPVFVAIGTGKRLTFPAAPCIDNSKSHV